MTFLTCPDSACAVLNPATAIQCEECGKSLFMGTFAQGKRRVPAHRVVAAQMIGRPLKPNEVVHHLNGDHDDNRPENLFVCANASEHSLIHSALRWNRRKASA